MYEILQQAWTRNNCSVKRVELNRILRKLIFENLIIITAIIGVDLNGSDMQHTIHWAGTIHYIVNNNYSFVQCLFYINPTLYDRAPLLHQLWFCFQL